MNKVKLISSEIEERWHKKMPKFFYWVVVIATGIGGLAVAINSSIVMGGGTPHEWWTDIYPYITGACGGTIFACKFTVSGGFRNVNPDNVTGKTVLDEETSEYEETNNRTSTV